MTYKTILPEHGEKEHVITEFLKAQQVEVACNQFVFNEDELETFEYSDPPESYEEKTDGGICSNCVMMITTLQSSPAVAV